jgi:hypothetical protein
MNLYVFYSKVLYELYKSIKKSKQDVGIEQGGLFNHTSFLKELVKQACDISGVPGIIVGDRLLQVFKTKLSALIEAVRKETAKGGGPVRRLLARWTTGRYSTWKFKIFYSELQVERLKEENKVLNAEKRKLEAHFNSMRCKKAKIESKLKEAVAKNQEMDGKFKNKFKLLTWKLIRQQRRQTSRGSTKSKTFSDYSRRHQFRICKQMVSDCETSLAFLGLNNFVATKVEVFNENNQQYKTINLINENEINTSPHTSETVTDEEIDDINLLLYTKERFNVSNDAYHELSMTCKELPRSW